MADYTDEQLESVYASLYQGFWRLEGNKWYVRDSPRDPWRRTTIAEARVGFLETLKELHPGQRAYHSHQRAYIWLRNKVLTNQEDWS